MDKITHKVGQLSSMNVLQAVCLKLCGAKLMVCPINNSFNGREFSGRKLASKWNLKAPSPASSAYLPDIREEKASHTSCVFITFHGNYYVFFTMTTVIHLIIIIIFAIIIVGIFSIYFLIFFVDFFIELFGLVAEKYPNQSFFFIPFTNIIGRSFFVTLLKFF